MSDVHNPWADPKPEPDMRAVVGGTYKISEDTGPDAAFVEVAEDDNPFDNPEALASVADELARVSASTELADLVAKAPNGAAIWLETLAIARMLLEKNLSYGNSALAPKRIFSGVDGVEQIKVRIDDKLSRIAAWPGEAQAPVEEDTLGDLIGYLILLRIAQRGGTLDD